MTYRVRVGCFYCARYSCTKVTKRVRIEFYAMFIPVLSVSLLISVICSGNLNYCNFEKCLQFSLGMCMLSQPGMVRNDPMKYIILILLLSGDIAENPGPAVDTSVKNLSICHINAQSVYNKLDLIAVELSKFDILTVSETWLDQTISNVDLKLPSYQPPIRLDRKRHGGGVAIYIKQCIPFFERTDLIIPNLEAAWVEVNLCNKKVLIGSFYIHPRFSDWGLVEVAIEQASQVCSNLILLGDFNQDMFIARKSQEIRGIMNMFGFKQIIDTPTRVTPYSSTLIDLILVSDSLSCTDRGTLEPFCSDHHAVYFSTNFMNIKSNCYIRKNWQYDNADFDLFRQKLQDCNWNIQNKNIGDQIQCIAENIIQSAEQSIPNKIVTIRPRDLPWFHNGIRRSIRKRNRLHGIAKRLNNPDN